MPEQKLCNDSLSSVTCAMPLRQLTHSEKAPIETAHDIVVIAESIHNPDNMGMIFRVCEAMGVKAIHFLHCSVELSNKKVGKAARNTERHVAHSIHHDLKILEQLRSQGYQLLGLEITTTSEDLRNATFPKGKYALVIGAERNGMSTEVLASIDRSIHIPMFGNNLSMNVVTAMSIGLFELLRQQY